MKRTLTILLIFTMAIPMAAWATDVPQPAQEEPAPLPEDPVSEDKNFLGENISMTASLKIWHTNIEFDNGTETSSFILGPSINLTFKEKYYAGMNYYTGDGFDYEVDSAEGEYSKTDFDLWAGYFFHPRGSVFLGYKYSKLEDEAIAEDSGVTVSGESDIILKGPVIGINGNYPIKDSTFILFGTLGYGFLTAEQDVYIEYSDSTDSISSSDDDTQDLSGFALELGGSYIFQNIPRLSLTGGYKYQKYTDENDQELTFSGFTFGANYRF